MEGMMRIRPAYRKPGDWIFGIIAAKSAARLECCAQAKINIKAPAFMARLILGDSRRQNEL
jgi:hypothetical protein